jgi:hypothetical protein
MRPERILPSFGGRKGSLKTKNETKNKKICF